MYDRAQPSNRWTAAAAGELHAVDVAVIGGGPAGLAAALWAARYRRRVLLVDGGRPRNRSTVATHGYLGTDGAGPWDLISDARKDLLDYPEVTFMESVQAVEVEAVENGFDVSFDDGRRVRALRLILATGVVDVLPDIDRFDEFFGSCAFTCPTCDGYEAQNKAIVVIGDQEQSRAFAIGMLDWVSSVTLIVDPTAGQIGAGELDEVRAADVGVVVGTPAGLIGHDGSLDGVRLSDGCVIECDMLFAAVDQVQHSDLADRLGCDISGEGCVVVDDDGRTSVPNVFAAGDMTPGPHLVQIAAADGARAGIAAALSLRGGSGVPGSPRPAPDPSSLHGS
jgi:thioredoxin reductase